uniref:Metalloendopeptidase n=1 Tax=Strongyloides venezuelensis TaxID=75913 RepID=A0A0K0F147_STRVS
MTGYNMLFSLIIKLILVFPFTIDSSNTYNEKDIKNISNNHSFLEIYNRKKRKIKGGNFYKWEMPIIYGVREPVNPFQIDFALNAISKETCIIFQKHEHLPRGKPGMLYIYTGDCESFVGKLVSQNWQGIQLGRHCEHPGGIIHETLHALGLFHEQCRIDRDIYLQIRNQNMDNNGKRNCLKVNYRDSNTYFLNYDYGSIMHYGSYSYSINNRKTFVTTDPNYYRTIGQTQRLSFIDIKTLNYHYCSDVCQNSIHCANQGYQNPKSCDKCRCVEGFSGTHCEEIAKQRRGCRKPLIMLADKTMRINFKSKKKCILHLKTTPGRVIVIKLVSINMYPYNGFNCFFKNSLEINYQVDKSLTGALFCSNDGSKLIISYNEHVILYYRSERMGNFVNLLIRSMKNGQMKLPARRLMRFRTH